MIPDLSDGSSKGQIPTGVGSKTDGVMGVQRVLTLLVQSMAPARHRRYFAQWGWHLTNPAEPSARCLSPLKPLFLTANPRWVHP